MTRLSRLRPRRTAAKRPRWATRFAILAASLFMAFVFAGTALAVITYKNGDLGAGGFASTSGWNQRDWNRACPNPSVGINYKAAVGYYNADMVLMHYSGVVYANCTLGNIARLENNGYFRCRCWNKDTITLPFVCQTTP